MKYSTRNDPTAPALLEERLGYRFRDPGLLRRALTHKSAGASNFERLEFLGDATLGFVVAQTLFEANVDASEERLSLMRANLVSAPALAALARELELGRFLILGKSERKAGGAERTSMLADALEAVLGAIVCDGGIDAAAAVARERLAGRLATPRNFASKDPKTRLQEHLQARQLALPEYRVEHVGPDHKPRFLATCRVAALALCSRGRGRSRRDAEKAAAAALLLRLDTAPREGASSPEGERPPQDDAECGSA